MQREEAKKWIDKELNACNEREDRIGAKSPTNYRQVLELCNEILNEDKKDPCHLCRFYPPSSSDGKPCTMCPAEGKD